MYLWSASLSIHFLCEPFNACKLMAVDQGKQWTPDTFLNNGDISGNFRSSSGRPWSSFAKRPPSLAGDLRSWKTSSKTAASCALSVVTDQCHRMSSDTNLIFLHFTFSLLHQIVASLHFPKPQLLHQI